jgi:general secretion pathway protein D
MRFVRLGFALLCLAALVSAQQHLPGQRAPVVPPGFQPAAPPPKPQAQQQQAPPPATQAKPSPTAPAPVPQTQTHPAAAATPVYGGLSLQNASLVEVIDMLARQLHINYILDPKVSGTVILNTYGETKNIDPRSLLDLILRINGFGMVKYGDVYRIVPLTVMPHLPLTPEEISNPKDIVSDDQPMLNLVFLKYATAEDLSKVLANFIGENANMVVYPPANLLFILDSRRDMRRIMELIAMFDSDVLAKKRVRLFDIKNARPSDLATELNHVMQAVSLGAKKSPVEFLPIDRINTLIAIAPNPGVFETVESWIQKLDVPYKNTGEAMQTYVYRVKYSRAECLAMSLGELYGATSPYGGGMGGYGMGGYGMGGYGMGGYGGYGGAGGYSPYGNGYTTPYGSGYGAGTLGAAASGLGVGGGCGGTMGGYGGGYGGYSGGYGGYGGGYGGYGYGAYAPQYPTMQPQPMAATTQRPAAGGSADQTGTYLTNGQQQQQTMPRIVPNTINNSLLIEATPAQYHNLLKLLSQIDIPPLQILLESKIYEVQLSQGMQSQISAYLQPQTSSAARQFVGSLVGPTTALSAGWVVGKSRELMAFLNLQETENKARTISAPSLIATDSIPASITVGTEVPVFTSESASSVQTGGTTNVVQGISSRTAGVTLNVMAEINPSGIVTLIINGEDSSVGAPPTSGPDTSSFATRNVQTQITMQDGDTIAIGGIINEESNYTSQGIPFLNRIPLLGAAFGSRTYSKGRTELIIFMTPHIIYDNTNLLEASQELKSRIRMLRRYVTE